MEAICQSSAPLMSAWSVLLIFRWEPKRENRRRVAADAGASMKERLPKINGASLLYDLARVCARQLSRRQIASELSADDPSDFFSLVCLFVLDKAKHRLSEREYRQTSKGCYNFSRAPWTQTVSIGRGPNSVDAVQISMASFAFPDPFSSVKVKVKK